MFNPSLDPYQAGQMRMMIRVYFYRIHLDNRIFCWFTWNLSLIFICNLNLGCVFLLDIKFHC